MSQKLEIEIFDVNLNLPIDNRKVLAFKKHETQGYLVEIGFCDKDSFPGRWYMSDWIPLCARNEQVTHWCYLPVLSPQGREGI